MADDDPYTESRRRYHEAMLAPLLEQQALARQLAQPKPPSFMERALGQQAPGEHFLKGVQRGLTMGYTGEDPDPGIAGGVGEFIGSVAPFGAALKAGGLVARGISSGIPPLAQALRGGAIGGALYGGLEKPEPEPGETDLRARLTGAAELAGAVPALELAGKGAAKGLKRLFKGKAEPPPEVPTGAKPDVPTAPPKLLNAPTDYYVTPAGTATKEKSVASMFAEAEAPTPAQRDISDRPGRKALPPPRASTVESDLASKSIDLYPQPDGTYRAVVPGGKVLRFGNKAEAEGFAATAPATPRQPVDVKTPDVPRGTVESTFDKMAGGRPLAGADKANLAAQKAALDASKMAPEQPTVADKLGAKATEGEETFPPIGGGELSRSEVFDIKVNPFLGKPEPLLVSPIADPYQTGSAAVFDFYQKATRAHMALAAENRQWGDWVKTKILEPLGNNETSLKQVGGVLSGDLKPSDVPEKVRQAAASAREMYMKIAPRAGLKADPTYFTRKTDMGQLYTIYRDKFLSMRSVRDFKPGEQSQAIGLEERSFGRLQEVMRQKPDWEALSKSEQRDMKALWNFDGKVLKFEELPPFVRDRVEKDIFTPYLLPRKGEAPYTRNIKEVLESYLPAMLKHIHLNPVIEEGYKKVAQVPGTLGAPYTTKGYLDNMIRKEAGELSWDDNFVKAMGQAIYKTTGKDLLTLANTQDVATLMRGGAYRNLLGPDSAIWNLAGNLNTWMATGRWGSLMGKYIIEKTPKESRKGLISEFTDIEKELTGLPEGKRSAAMQKALELDEWMNRWALSPFAFIENLNRGRAAQAGIEEALRKGLTADKMLVNVMAKSSDMVPNLEVPEALLYASLRTIPETQFGGPFSSQRTPFFRGPLGRLSTILTTYPTKQAHFLYRGFADALREGDHYKLARFTAGLGLMAGLPTLAAAAGYNIRNQFGFGSMFGNLNLPFWSMMMNSYNAVLGADPLSKEQARDHLAKALLHFQPIVPQTRYAEKVADVFKNIERGYDVDKLGRYVHDTTPLGELMRLAGPSPEAKVDTYEMSRYLNNEAQQFSMDRQKAIYGYLDTKDPSLLQAFMQKYPDRQITMKDLMRAQKERMKPPQERALSRFPKAMRERMRREAQEEAEGF